MKKRRPRLILARGAYTLHDEGRWYVLRFGGQFVADYELGKLSRAVADMAEAPKAKPRRGGS